jgi:hypothetical protein
MVRDVRAVEFLKAPRPMVVSSLPFSKETELSADMTENAPSPIAVTCFGITIDSRALDPANA